MENITKTINNNFVFFTLNNDWNIGSNIREGNIWEPYMGEFINCNLNSESVFLDIGSNYGYHSITASRICKDVYSYEPQKVLYELQLKSILDNNITNIKPLNVAIGNFDGKIEMNPIDYEAPSNFGNLSVGEGGEITTSVKLDSLTFETLDLIKIDVQGYEKFVIEGGKSTIEKFRPLMIIEFEEVHTIKFGYTCKDLFNMLQDMNYYLIQFESYYPSDYLCVPIEKIEEFKNKNNHLIKPLVEDNEINYGLKNGITEKIIY